MIILQIKEPIPSQNKTDREHWSITHRRNKRYQAQLKTDLLLAYRKKDRDKYQSRPAFAKVNIHSQRTRRILDNANLRGGCKGLIDSLTKLGLIFDDEDKYVEITYTQGTGKPYYTQITIEADYGN